MQSEPVEIVYLVVCDVCQDNPGRVPFCGCLLCESCHNEVMQFSDDDWRELGLPVGGEVEGKTDGD